MGRVDLWAQLYRPRVSVSRVRCWDRRALQRVADELTRVVCLAVIVAVVLCLWQVGVEEAGGPEAEEAAEPAEPDSEDDGQVRH
jgi:hypothetical protein